MGYRQLIKDWFFGKAANTNLTSNSFATVTEPVLFVSITSLVMDGISHQIVERKIPYEHFYEYYQSIKGD